MATITFDTLKYSKRLKDAGVPEQQAEAEAEALSEVLEINLKDIATKEDLAREVDLLRRDMKEMEQRLTIKLGGMMMVSVGIVAALVKLL